MLSCCGNRAGWVGVCVGCGRGLDFRDRDEFAGPRLGRMQGRRSNANPPKKKGKKKKEAVSHQVETRRLHCSIPLSRTLMSAP